MRPLAGNEGASAAPTRQAQREQSVDCGRGAEHPNAALQDREDGPDEDTAEIDDLRAEPVEQPAAGDLAGDIGPAEGREHVPHPDRRQAEFLRHHRPGNGERRPVGIVHDRHDAEHRDDAEPDPAQGRVDRPRDRRHRLAPPRCAARDGRSFRSIRRDALGIEQAPCGERSPQVGCLPPGQRPGAGRSGGAAIVPQHREGRLDDRNIGPVAFLRPQILEGAHPRR